MERAITLPTLATITQAKDTTASDSHLKVDIRALNVYYRAFRAVADVTMPVYANQITAIIGPSGCGKSTLLRSLNRMNDLTPGARVAGQITLNGQQGAQDIYAPGVDV